LGQSSIILETAVGRKKDAQGICVHGEIQKVEFTFVVMRHFWIVPDAPKACVNFGYPPYTTGMTAKTGGGLTLGITLLRGQATTRKAPNQHVGQATRSNPTHYLPGSSVNSAPLRLNYQAVKYLGFVTRRAILRTNREKRKI